MFPRGIILSVQPTPRTVFDTPERIADYAKIAEEAARAIRHVMESVAPQDRLSGVPILAEASMGKDWGTMKKLPR